MEASNLCYGCMAPRSTGNFCKLCGYNYSKGPDSERYIKPGTLINDYVFGKVLNESAYEIAYLGYHLASKKKVALKEFMPHKLAKRSGNSPQLIVEEGPNSIKFATNLQRFIQSGSNLFTFEANHTAYHVIEKVSKISLQAYLNQSGGRISYDQALVFVMQVLSQVEKYHGQGELLLDLNPAQIQVSTNGEISIQNSNEEIQHVVNGFSAKEMYFPAGNRGFFSDVYSIGAIAYYMLTGIVPEVAIERMKGRVLKPIGLLRSDINPGFGSAIMKALSVEASDRFETTQDLRQAIMNNIERSVTVIKPVPLESSQSVNDLLTEKNQVITEPLIEEPVITEPLIAVTQQYYQQTYTPLENNGQPKAGVTSDTINRQIKSATPEKKKNKIMLALLIGFVVAFISTVVSLLILGASGITILDLVLALLIGVVMGSIITVVTLLVLQRMLNRN